MSNIINPTESLVQQVSGTTTRYVRTDGGGAELTLVAGDYTAQADDNRIVVTDTSAARTITLPALATVPSGLFLTVKDGSGGAGTNAITIDGNGSETIDGALTVTIAENRGHAELVAGPSGWIVVGGNVGVNDGAVIETLALSGGTDATFAIPAGADAIRITGKFATTLDANIVARFDGTDADDQGFHYVDVNGAVVGTGAVAQAFLATHTSLNFIDATIICTGALKLAQGVCVAGNATNGSCYYGHAKRDSAAVLASLVLRLSAGAWSAGSRLTSRRVVLP